MAGMGLQQTQRASQIQTQKMSQQQIYSLNLLAMNSEDLRSEIYAASDKNPALEITKDSSLSGSDVPKISKGPSDYTRVGSVSASGQEKSDMFQEALESHPDERCTLQEHLLSQLNLLKIPPEKYELSKKLIENLDSSGFYILAPVTLLDKDNPQQTEPLLESCISLVRHLDPLGICCANFQESLFVQASYLPDAPQAALFLLDGHFDFLDPPRSLRILKRIKSFTEEKNKMTFAVEDAPASDYHPENFTQKDIEDALSFIRTLDPHPARQFGSSSNAYVVPDVYVTKIPVSSDLNDENHRAVSGSTISGRGQFSYRVTMADNVLPSVALSPGYVEIDKKTVSKADKQFINTSLQEAKVFIENLNFRNETIIKACSEIVRFQLAFFEKGPKYLAPLRQKDVADAIGVHEATISRMASSKYIQCEWGLFPVKYFFTNAVSSIKDVVTEPAKNIVKAAAGNIAQTETDAVRSGSDSEPEIISKESVKYEIEQIVKAQKNGEKRLSDQKIADLLEKRGIKVARRTVAKYRSQLNIDSSYSR